MNNISEGKKFAVGDAVRYGWQAFRENAGILILTLIVGYGIIFGFQYLLAVIEEMSPQDAAATEFFGEATAVWWIHWPFIILGAVASWLIGIGIANIQLKIYRKEPVSLQNLFQRWEVLPHVVLASILSTVVTGAGFIALIIPGIYLMARLSQVNYFIVDKGMDAVSAFKASFAATKKQFWSLAGLFITLALINILGALALLVGLLVTVPMSMMALVYVYYALAGGADQIGNKQTQPPAL